MILILCFLLFSKKNEGWKRDSLIKVSFKKQGITTFSMKIRKVQMQDIPQIKTIADSLVVTSENQYKNYGFYDYNLTNEQYAKRSKSDLFLVGLNNSILEGFCMAYDSQFIQRLIEQEPQLIENEIFRYLTEQQKNYVYIDQLAVREPKSFKGATCACELFNRIKGESRGKAYIQGVSPHIPWKNEFSIRFFSHQGARFIREIKGSEGLIFGVYQLDLV